MFWSKAKTFSSLDDKLKHDAIISDDGWLQGCGGLPAAADSCAYEPVQRLLAVRGHAPSSTQGTRCSALQQRPVTHLQARKRSHALAVAHSQQGPAPFLADTEAIVRAGSSHGATARQLCAGKGLCHLTG